MSEFSFDHLETMGQIIHKPLSDSYATLLPRGDGLWKSTYSLLSLPSSGNITVACFDGSANEELTISVMAGMYVSNYYHVSCNITKLISPSCDNSSGLFTLNILPSLLCFTRHPN